MYNDVRKLMQPYVGAGNTALDELSALLGFQGKADPSEVRAYNKQQAQLAGNRSLNMFAGLAGNQLDKLTKEYQLKKSAIEARMAGANMWDRHKLQGKLSSLERQYSDQASRLSGPMRDAYSQMKETGPLLERPVGESGDIRQQRAFDQIMAGPQFQTMMQQGEEAILSNAAATGGLRGGNVQSALMQFRPQLLNQLVQQRMQQLSGLAQLGQQSGVQQGATGMQMASNVGNIGMQNAAQQANAQMGMVQGISGAVSGAANSIGQGLMFNQMMGKL
jgi:hypothetical protein